MYRGAAFREHKRHLSAHQKAFKRGQRYNGLLSRGLILRCAQICGLHVREDAMIRCSGMSFALFCLVAYLRTIF
jgi:hypothetical protein